MQFHEVRCPRARGGCGRLLGRIALGLAEFPCHRCKLRVQAGSDGSRVTRPMVTPLPRSVKMAG
jgi:hypothetical protein